VKKRCAVGLVCFLFVLGLSGGTFAGEAVNPTTRSSRRASSSRSLGDREGLRRHVSRVGRRSVPFLALLRQHVVGLENFKKHAEQWRTLISGHPLRVQGSAHRLLALRRRGLVLLLPRRLRVLQGQGVLSEERLPDRSPGEEGGRWVHVLMHGSYPSTRSRELRQEVLLGLFEKSDPNSPAAPPAPDRPPGRSRIGPVAG